MIIIVEQYCPMSYVFVKPLKATCQIKKMFMRISKLKLCTYIYLGKLGAIKRYIAAYT